MRRIHLSLGVPDVAAAVPFFEALLGVPATDVREDFAKFLVDDPGLNLALSSRDAAGVGHLGLQVDSTEELASVVSAVRSATGVSEPAETTCCHARSTKGWAMDPAGLPWELFTTHEYVEEFGVSTTAADVAADIEASTESTGGCCAPEAKPPTSIGCC